MDYQQLSLTEWLYYLENRHPQEIKLDLERIGQVARHLGLLSWTIPSILVGGTNGKGSTVRALEEIYTAAGYVVASYTSPHLLRFNERICINKQPITDEVLCRAFTYIETNSHPILLTYFEMATLAALWYFKQNKIDLMILEVGLGGRLDATNIIEPHLSIITTIDLDHQELLGDTIEKIAYEKAGILRENKPFVYGDINPPQNILAASKQLNTKMYSLARDFSYEVHKDSLKISIGPKMLTLPKPSLHIKAVASAIMACECLQNILPVPQTIYPTAVSQMFLAGRQEVIAHDITTILDVAHNPQAVKLLVQRLNQRKRKGRVHAVFSALKDKDLRGLIVPLLPYVDFWYIALLTGKRASTEQMLQDAFAQVGIEVPTCFANPLLAYQKAQEAAKKQDEIIVYGSFLMIQAIRNRICNSRRSDNEMGNE